MDQSALFHPWKDESRCAGTLHAQRLMFGSLDPECAIRNKSENTKKLFSMDVDGRHVSQSCDVLRGDPTCSSAGSYCFSVLDGA